MANNNSLNNTSYGFTLPSLNLNFTSTAQRITGDMSNATHANRLSFQTNVVNGATSPFIIPNGTGTIGQIVVANASDPTNSAFGSLQVDAASVKLVSNVLGLGVQLPIEIRIGTTAAIDISTSRAVSIANTVVGNVPLTITGTNAGGLVVNQATSGVASIYCVQSSADAQPVYINNYKSRSGGNINANDVLGQSGFYGFATTYQNAAQSRCYAESIGATRVSGAFDWFTTSTAGVSGQRLYLGSDGNVVINTPVAALTALTVNGFNTAGTYAQRNVATTAGGIFEGLLINNASTAAGSGSRIDLQVNGQLAATGGDPELRFYNAATQTVSIGLDTSVNQLSMSTGALGDGGTFFTYDVATTQINLPRQCAFSYSAAAQPNITGAGGIYTVAFANIGYNVGGVGVNAAFTNFQMPKTGKYLISIQIVANGIAAGMTLGYFQLYRNGVAFRDYAYTNPFVVQSGGTYIFSGTSLLSLTTGDVLAVVFYINGGAGNDVDIPATTSAYISGQLLS